MEDLKVIFAQNLTALRKQMQLTQIELADKINYSDKAVSKWERGESLPDVSVLLVLAKLFGVSIDFLVTEHSGGEVKTQQTNYTSRIKKKNRLLISAITFIAMLIAETIVFISLNGAHVSDFLHNALYCFVLPLPVFSIVAIVFSSLWASKTIRFISVSSLVWTILVDVFVILLICGPVFPWVFVLGIPTEIIVMMSFKIKILPTASKKNTPTDETNNG